MSRVAGRLAVLVGMAAVTTGAAWAAPPAAKSDAAPAIKGASARDEPPAPAPLGSFRKIVIEKKFRSEGVAIADVNGDGKKDILVGDLWYAAPDWKPCEIRKCRDYGDGSGGYSECFACWAEDFNGDGRPDLLVVGFPGKPAIWYENPGRFPSLEGGQPLHWKAHTAWHSACNETPQFVDLFGDGKRVLLMGWQPPGKEREGQMSWFEPDAKDATVTWVQHAVSGPAAPGKQIPGTFKYDHGLGVGDVNGDGRLDVIVPAGWWEQPAEGRAATAPWAWHPGKLGEACADMYAMDLTGDGKPDVISSAAHRTGVWWHQQLPGEPNPNFKTSVITRDFSQTHAVILVDLFGTGRRGLVTGKRFWAHGPKGDDNPGAPAVLYFIDVKPAAIGSSGAPVFELHKLDDDSGVGTQFQVTDVDGDCRLDIAVSNKKGVFLFLQNAPAGAK